MSVNEDSSSEPTDQVDTGDFLAVAEDQRLDFDEHDPSEDNEDQFGDLSDVKKDGELVELETAHLDDPDDDGSQIKTGRDF